MFGQCMLNEMMNIKPAEALTEIHQLFVIHLLIMKNENSVFEKQLADFREDLIGKRLGKIGTRNFSGDMFRQPFRRDRTRIINRHCRHVYLFLILELLRLL